MFEQVRQIVVFEVCGKRLGLPTPLVTELLRAVEIDSLPDHDDLMQGVVNVRGNIVPVVNVRSILGEQTREPIPSDYFVLVNHDNHHCALLVDGVEDLADLPMGTYERELDGSDLGKYTRGVAKLERGLVIILNVEPIFAGLTMFRRESLLQGSPK